MKDKLCKAASRFRRLESPFEILYFFKRSWKFIIHSPAPLLFLCLTSDLLIGSYLRIANYELVNFKLKQYFHYSVISGPIIFCLLIACFSGDSLVMSEHLINSSAYYKLRLSVLKSPFWLVTLLAPKWYLQAWGTNSPLVRVVTSCPTRTRANKGVFNSLFRELWRLPARHILEHNESWVQKLVTIGQISLSQPKQQSGQPDLRGHALSQSGLKLITKIRR